MIQSLLWRLELWIYFLLANTIDRWTIHRSAKPSAMWWNQIIEMGVAALVLFVLVQNAPGAKDLGTTLIDTTKTTLTNLFSGLSFGS